MCVLEYRRTAITMNKPPKSGLAFDADFEHPTFQGATAPTRGTQGVATLALCYVLHWAFSPSLLIRNFSKIKYRFSEILTY